jgi:hypothetical protein
VRVATCARVSTESQEARGTIGSQLELLGLKMAELGNEIVHQYQDDGYSGARLDRPGLDALRDAAEAALFQQFWCLTTGPPCAQLSLPGQQSPLRARASLLPSFAARGNRAEEGWRPLPDGGH